MKNRALPFLLLLPTLGCPLLESGQHAESSTRPPSDGDVVPDAGEGGLPGWSPPLGGTDLDGGIGVPLGNDGTAPGSLEPASGALPPAQLAPAIAALVARPGWGTDADGGAQDAGVTAPSDAESLPAVDPASGTLALARLVGAGGPKGCGEPPRCYLRAAILTASGRLYTARLSSAYPQDTCARDIIDDGKNILIGDSHGRFGHSMCARSSPQITVGFLLPNQVFGTVVESQWTSRDGFRSEWAIANGAPGDNGAYLPAPDNVSTVDLLWFGRFRLGEGYGSLFVPLRNMATGAAAIGALIFDVQIR